MFDSYTEALGWVRANQAIHGKMAFTATEAYKAAYPEILRLSQEAGAKRMRRTKKSSSSLLSYSLHNS